jgi:hypothetical protein
MIPLVVAALKAVPALESILRQALAIYAVWRRQQNAQTETKTNETIDDAIARAGASAPELCDACPYRDGAPGSVPR